MVTKINSISIYLFKIKRCACEKKKKKIRMNEFLASFHNAPQGVVPQSPNDHQQQQQLQSQMQNQQLTSPQQIKSGSSVAVSTRMKLYVRWHESSTKV